MSSKLVIATLIEFEAFLDQVPEGRNPASLLASRPAPAPRRRLRELVQVDEIPATLDTAPANITFAAGRLAIEFAAMDQLAGALLEKEGARTEAVGP